MAEDPADVWPPAPLSPDGDRPCPPGPARQPSLVGPLLEAIFYSAGEAAWIWNLQALPSVKDGPLSAFSHYGCLALAYFFWPLCALGGWVSFGLKWRKRSQGAI